MKKNNKDIFAQWYIITVVSGKEEMVIKNLISKIRTLKYEQNVFNMQIVKEQKIEETIFNKEEAPICMRNTTNIKWETINDKGVIKYKKIKKQVVNKFPGYIFIKMILDDELWFIIRNTELVTGLVGSSGKNSKPIPISEEEVQKMIGQNEHKNIVNTNENVNKTIVEHSFKINSEITFSSGIFEGEIGRIIALNNNKATATIEVYAMGQKITIETPFSEIINK